MTGKSVISCYVARPDGANTYCPRAGLRVCGCSQVVVLLRGGMVVWRCAVWYPELVSHVFAVCTPYTPPVENYIPTETLVKGPLPQFGYQLHLASPEVEGTIQSKDQIRQFLNGMYGARTPDGQTIFTPEKGIVFENLPKVGKSRLLTDRVSITFGSPEGGRRMVNVWLLLTAMDRKWTITSTNIPAVGSMER
jgi:hypothetical protein